MNLTSQVIRYYIHHFTRDAADHSGALDYSPDYSSVCNPDFSQQTSPQIIDHQSQITHHITHYTPYHTK